MAFITNPGARQCVLHHHFISDRYPVLLNVSPQPGGGWRAGCAGMLCHRDLSGEAQAVRLGPTVPPLARDVPHLQHLPSGFSVTNKKCPSRLSGCFVPKAGITT